MSSSNTERFSNRVNDYVKYRPGYPQEMVDYLQEEYQLQAGMMIADIGAGTGISAELFLKSGYKVAAVEPNIPMREKAIELLQHYPCFSATSGTAEETKISDGSVDAVIAAQAFHWFDKESSKKEFIRILNDTGLAVFIWNERLTSPGFETDYDSFIIKHARDYVKVDHRNVGDDDMQTYFSPQLCKLKTFSNKQDFNFEGLKGRLLSSSYMPAKGDAGYNEMIADLKKLFDQYQEEGMIRINYEVKVYAGRLK